MTLHCAVFPFVDVAVIVTSPADNAVTVHCFVDSSGVTDTILGFEDDHVIFLLSVVSDGVKFTVSVSVDFRSV